MYGRRNRLKLFKFQRSFIEAIVKPKTKWLGALRPIFFFHCVIEISKKSLKHAFIDIILETSGLSFEYLEYDNFQAQI